MGIHSGVRIPASTSNLGPGFDCLGCALEVYLEVRVEAGEDRHRVVASGVDCERMPQGDENLILRVLNRVAERRGQSVGPQRLLVRNEVPLARGLGSSATAILAGVSCYELVTGDHLSVEEIIDYGWEFEPHADNLSASLLGGLTVAVTSSGSSNPGFLRLAIPEGLTPVLVIPDFEVETRMAREVLPDSYSRSDLVFNIQRAAQLVGALTTGRWEYLAEGMKDRVHQPYRTGLVPGLEQVLALKADGLYGIALSGAGPTVLALTDPARSGDVGQRVADLFGKHGVSVKVQVSRIDIMGRTFLD